MSRSGFATIIQFTSEPCAAVNGWRNNGQFSGSDGIERGKISKKYSFCEKMFVSLVYVRFAKFYTLSSSPSPSFSLFLSFSLSLSLSFSLFFSFFQILRKVVKFISALSNDVMCSCIPLSGIVFLEPSRKLFKKRHVTRVLLESMFNQCVQVYCFTNSISDFISWLIWRIVDEKTREISQSFAFFHRKNIYILRR